MRRSLPVAFYPSFTPTSSLPFCPRPLASAAPFCVVPVRAAHVLDDPRAFKCESLFLRLSCVGIVGMWAFQTFENIGMCIGVMPITGIPLPFISYGGTNLVVNMAGVGLVLNVTQHKSSMDLKNKVE